MMTDRNSEVCNADLRPPPRRRPSPRPRPETLHSAITERDEAPEKPAADRTAWIKSVRAYFTPPPMLTERRPAAETMRLYARRGQYAPLTGSRRALGIAWCNAVAVPYTAWSRTKEWVVERPTRYLVVAVTVKLLSELPPVEWTVDTIVKPGAAFVLWLFV
ncbi:hypothetical protein ABGB07_44900 [Micromonosporaceae bacterium B7E4]